MQSSSCYCCLSCSGHLPSLSDHLEFCTFLSVTSYFIITCKFVKYIFLAVLNVMLGYLTESVCVPPCFRIWGSRFLNCWVQFQWIMVFTLWLLLHLYGMKEDKIKMLLEQRYVYTAMVTLNCSNSFKWFESIKDKIWAFQWIIHIVKWKIFMFYF